MAGNLRRQSKHISSLYFLGFLLCFLAQGTQAAVTLELSKNISCWLGKSGEASIKIVNKSNHEIAIQNISTDCGCAIVLWDKAKIGVDKESNIIVRLKCGFEAGPRSLALAVAYQSDSGSDRSLKVKQMKINFVVAPSPVTVYPTDKYIGIVTQEASLVSFSAEIKILNQNWQLTSVTSDKAYKFETKNCEYFTQLTGIKMLEPGSIGVFEDDIELSFSDSLLRGADVKERIRVTYLREQEDIKIRQDFLEATKAITDNYFETKIEVILPLGDRIVSVSMANDRRGEVRVESTQGTLHRILVTRLHGDESSVDILIESDRSSKWALSLPVMFR